MDSRGTARQIEIDVVVKRSTEKAILVNFGVPKEEWIPKSQISDFTSDDDIDTATSIFIPEWLATEKGMV